MDFISKKLEPLVKKIQGGHEFECSFTNTSSQGYGQFPLPRFLAVLRRALDTDFPRMEMQSLDISYSVHHADSLRLTVTGSEAIDSILRTFYTKPPSALVSILVGRVLNPKRDVITPEAMLKEKEKFRGDMYEDQEYGMRFRLAREASPSDDMLRQHLVPSDLQDRSVTFRYKHRVSIKLFKDKTTSVSLDLTSVRQSNLLNTLGRSLPSYEIELDLTTAAAPLGKKALTTFFEAIPKVLGWMQGCSPESIIGRTESEQVLAMYRARLQSERFYQMKPVSLDTDRFLDLLPNNYGVTDKADGETAVLYITEDGECFLLNNNLEVTKPGLRFKGVKGPVVAEGELISMDGDKFSYLLLYDCLVYADEDLRHMPLLSRVQRLDELLTTLSHGKQRIPDDADLSGFGEHLRQLPQDAQLRITRKIYLFPQGIHRSQIYELAEDMWEGMVDLPYARDGLIFTGIEQPYTMDVRETRYPIFKWKPPALNSIDFYVEFVKRRDGSTELLFDKTSGAVPADLPFVTLRLFVGRRRGGREFPVPFLEKEGKSRATLYVSEDDPLPKDLEGHPINDGTVVEMVYDRLASGTPDQRWKVLRTRFDKTQSVQLRKVQYGNNEDVANKIWETVLNPVRMEDFHGMATEGERYATSMRSRHTSFAYSSASKTTASSIGQDGENGENDPAGIQRGSDEAYYQFQTQAGRPMRRFHNAVKETLISYLAPKRELGAPTPKRLSVLDIGVGRGGDIYKMWHVRIKDLVGIDPDEYGLFTSSDCARNRYREAMGRHTGFPPMHFIQADAGLPFNQVEAQVARFPEMTGDNKVALKKHLGSSKAKFQAINAQFMIHYLFTEHGISGLCANIEHYLVEDGIMVITCFNADRVRVFLGDATERSEKYMDAKGEEHPLFTIRNVSVDSKGEPGLEQAIDVFVGLYMNEGTFYTEYLVYPEVIIREFRERAGMALIDRCSFSFLRDVAQAYGADTYFQSDNSVEEASRKLSDLYEVYVFQKKSFME